MKKLMISIGAAALLLSACASDGDYYRPHYRGAMGYDAYYDGFYGPFSDGYWGGDGLFYYRHGFFGGYAPDRAGHFHHDMSPGLHDVHGRHR
jgi:hypothetical protein